MAHKPTPFLRRQFHWSTRTQSYYRISFPLCILGFTSYISLKFLVVWITFFKPIVLRITFRFQIINIWLMLIMISSPLNLQAGYSSPTQSAIREDLNLSLAEYSLFGSILTFGLMIGAIASGPMADFFGRKGAPRISTAFCTAGWLAIYFAQGPLPLDIGRLATGFGMGVFSYVVPVFIAEIAPKN